MTYCLGIWLPTGLVLASDSRTSAGVDQISTVKKLALFETPGERVVAILSAGNLATTQAVISMIRQAAGRGGTIGPEGDILAARSLFDVAQTVGAVLREVMRLDRSHVEPYGDPTASFLVGGQVAGDGHRLFQIYSAGNFVEASSRNPFLQLGETKYGKPILDRALTMRSGLDEAAKLALLSFDATIRSNLSVAPPIDLLRYEAGSLTAGQVAKFTAQHPYWADLRERYSDGLSLLVASLPEPRF
ncbi:peptidase [Bosea sp. (in: a-proteobacteria)]|jgi:putative proteasome-type protease|uniref:peptidase n=1 Tax=Bosea sp. (in: a-proteobacteria) TaxID=1871050 RepID=UPI0025C3700B|nr:peptidase [Bosea sp. (in: a-proteobacteria)]